MPNNFTKDTVFNTQYNHGSMSFNKEILSEFSAKEDEIVAIIVSDAPTENTWYDGSVLTVDVETLKTDAHDSHGAIYAYHDMTMPFAKSLGSWKESRGGKNLLMGKGKYSTVTFAKDIRTMMEEGIINCTSIGLNWSYGRADHDEEEGSLLIKEGVMYEWSVLPGWTQANKDAKIEKFSSQLGKAMDMDLDKKTLDTMFPGHVIHTQALRMQKELDIMGQKVLDLEKVIKYAKSADNVDDVFKVAQEVYALTDMLKEFKI